MVGIRRRFSCERQTTAHSLDPAFRLRKPVRNWILRTVSRRSLHFRQRALCLGGVERKRNYRQQSCLSSGVSGLLDCRTLHRGLVWQPINSEEELESALLPRAIVEGIDVEEPFPFLLYGHANRAAGRFFCAPNYQHDRELSERQSLIFRSRKRPSR